MAKKEIPWADFDWHVERGWKELGIKRLLNRQVREIFERLISEKEVTSIHSIESPIDHPCVLAVWRIVIPATPQEHVGDIWFIAGQGRGRKARKTWSSSVDLVIQVKMGWNRNDLEAVVKKSVSAWTKGFRNEIRVKEQLKKLMHDLGGIFCLCEGDELDIYGVDILVQFELQYDHIPSLPIDAKSSRRYAELGRESLVDRGIDPEDWYFIVVGGRVTDHSIYQKLKKRIEMHIARYKR